MKFKLKVIAIVLLSAITIFSITTVNGATTTVTIEGKGTAYAECKDGITKWECKPPSQKTCTITMVFQQ
jgi:hypothetical protein